MNARPPVHYKYDPSCFNVGDEEAARGIILTPEGGLTTDERWERETPYLMSLMSQMEGLGRDSVVLDYGCGIGRLSRELIDRYDCHCLGWDTSPSMRALGTDYISSPNYVAMDPKMNWILPDDIVTHVVAVWVFQHIPNLASIFEDLNRVCAVGAKLFVCNDTQQVIPTTTGWVGLQLDLIALLHSKGWMGEKQILDGSVMSTGIANRSFWGIFTKV